MRSLWIWIRFLAELFIIIVLAFLAIIRVTFREFTPNNVTVLSDTVTEYRKADSGGLDIYLSEYNNIFSISTSDMRFLDEEKFVQEVGPGSQLHIAIGNNARTLLNSPSGPKVIAVLEVRSDSAAYLPLASTAAARKQDITVTVPIIGLALLVILVPLVLVSRRAGDFDYVRKSFIAYLTSRTRNREPGQ